MSYFMELCVIKHLLLFCQIFSAVMVVHEKEGTERSVPRPLHLHGERGHARCQMENFPKSIGLISRVHPEKIWAKKGIEKGVE